ncbi:MAG TPA: TMEM175 family protein [Acetobacteraceae bacterium]|jgi:uncharacterized membrane protein
MNPERLTAFSDGVIAIIITIMVLDLHPPAGTDWYALAGTLPFFLTYAMSFVYVAIYWNNHHHLLHTVRHVTGAIMWANLGLLFFLSLTPFATAWLGAHYRAPVPTAVYGLALLMPALAYFVLQTAIIAAEGHGSVLAQAVGRDLKGKGSLVLYASAIGLAFVDPWLSDAIYALVAAIWLIPDRRIARRFVSEEERR